MLVSSLYEGVGIPKSRNSRSSTKVYSRHSDLLGHPNTDLAAADFLRDLLGRQNFTLQEPVEAQLKRRKEQKCSFIGFYKGRSVKVQTGYKSKWYHPEPYPYEDLHVPFRLWEQQTEADIYVQAACDFDALMITHMGRALQYEPRIVKRTTFTDNEAFFPVPLEKTYTFYSGDTMWWPKNPDLCMTSMMNDLCI